MRPDLIVHVIEANAHHVVARWHVRDVDFVNEIPVLNLEVMISVPSVVDVLEVHPVSIWAFLWFAFSSTFLILA